MRSTIKMNFALLLALPILLLNFTSAGASSLTLIAKIPVTPAPPNPAVGYLGGPGWNITANPSPPPPLLTNASFDLLSYDPVRQIMYSADRPNHAVDVIDTKTNTLLGFIPLPNNCNVGGTSCPSGVQVAPDIRKLVVTDRGTGAAGGGVYVYDLTASALPQAPQAVGGTFQFATDELNYDPLNHRVYVNNTTNTGDPLGRYFMTVIDIQTGTVIGQIPIASGANSPEQPRFDPKDGFIYTTTGGNSTLLRINPNFVLDPTNPANNLGAIVKTIQLPGCSPAGFDINPVDNLGLLGCNPGAPNGFPQELINLNNDSIVRVIPGITATDVLAFDPSLRRTSSASNGRPVQPARLAAAAAGQIGTMRSAISSVERRCATMTREIVTRRMASLIARSLSSSRWLVASSSRRIRGLR